MRSHTAACTTVSAYTTGWSCCQHHHTRYSSSCTAYPTFVRVTAEDTCDICNLPHALHASPLHGIMHDAQSLQAKPAISPSQANTLSAHDVLLTGTPTHTRCDHAAAALSYTSTTLRMVHTLQTAVHITGRAVQPCHQADQAPDMAQESGELKLRLTEP